MQRQQDRAGGERATRPRWWHRRWFHVTASLALLVFVSLLIGAEYLLHHAEPIVRKRIIETLSARFGAPVALDRVNISLFEGVVVDGWGLRIPSRVEQASGAPAPPMIAVEHFAFRTTLMGFLRQPIHVASVSVEGMQVHVPPPGGPAAVQASPGSSRPAVLLGASPQAKFAIVVNELRCRSVKLVIESGKPGKQPMEFDIASLKMRDVGPRQAMLYDAELTNPKPVGLIHAVGHFGPWEGSLPAANPGQTPLDGRYSFDHADLNTIKGIGGMLSSSGRFAGVLDKIAIDGETDTPDFSLDISNRPLPLHTRFHAIVDGTDGDTALQAVHARLADSEFTTSGEVVKVDGSGHDIDLDVDVPHGRMQDFLRLAVKTNPPLMNGALSMKAKLHIPPGNVRVPEKLAMEGTFGIVDVRFNNPKLQDRVDGLSARAKGKPKQVALVSTDRETEVHSRLSAHFRLGHGIMTATDVRYSVPGALVLLNGVYSMDGKLFEFKGHVRTEATASQMVTGWKSWLLKPVDVFLKKDGAGLELPIEVSGTEGDVHLGLALHGADDTPREMLNEVRDKRRERRELDEARRESAQADAEDARAAHGASLADAKRAHAAAARLRALAHSHAQAAQQATGSPDP